ncbi:hypothetical protein LEP1GSC047_1096 [Leptospira inadai serovar Lyme str. 10]|uniref:Uncharacterized protein n=2 Tax=Leptospira inadai serovar Lyme TaxID=293084 RepID=V6HQM4_9LEPT|nr:hypothetical protein [Leptospira inadai]EQA34749.1 hypothetical protein LEP1GSC047_1096 [Leptospira inadai serovar Lyme str. 10]PNV72447.1 hypothetical protein BES34_019290 [Leptospira inadai serovar Lyme]
MNDAAEKFWQWFAKEHSAYSKIDRIDDEDRDRLFDELMDRLQEVNEEFYFEIAGEESGPQELTIITAGDESLYAEAERFVDLAPQIPGWEIFSSDHSQSEGFTLSYEGIEFDSEEIWFLPLENPQQPESFGLKVCVPDYEPIADHPGLRTAVTILLETVLGEEEFPKEIQHFEIGPIPDDPDEEGCIELAELPDYLEWRKERENA